MKNCLLLCFILVSSRLTPLAHAIDPIPAAGKAPQSYPLTTCVVSGEKLGEMSPPVVITYQGGEVRFCCPREALI